MSKTASDRPAPSLLPGFRPRPAASAPADAVLVLQRSPNPSTDYYLRPRLEGAATPWRIVDLTTPPAEVEEMAREDGRRLWVILCRYASARWLSALEGLGPRLVRASWFADDDLMAGMRDAAIPLSMRAHWALHYGRHAGRIGRLANETWVSTPRLAGIYAAMAPRVLNPVPEADPRPPAPADSLLVCYHATRIHAAERRFVAALAKAFPADRVPIRFEITGDRALARELAGLAHVQVVAEQPWSAYRQAQAGRGAAVVLAPLFDTPLNAARAPVKAFDAARLGAAGLYADAAPYAGFVRAEEDGVLAPMRIDAWVDALAELMDNPERRRALAAAAADRLRGLRRTVAPLN